MTTNVSDTSWTIQPEVPTSVADTISATLLFDQLTTTGLNCGYHCPPRIYNKPMTRYAYETLTAAERDVIKEEYYNSYDYMTGLRTAASLGGTILLFSVFVLYKMNCRQSKKRASTHSSVPVEGKGPNDPDVEKEGGMSSGGSPGLMAPDKPLLNVVLVNNVNSRRSSRTALYPDDLPVMTRARFNSVATTSSCNDESRFFDDLPLLGLPSRPVTPLTPLPKVLPRFVASDDYDQVLSPARLLRPELSVEPIDIHIIQPTPNVSPCGSIRRLSEDVGALIENRRSRAGGACPRSPALVPLLALPRAHHSKSRCKSKMRAGDRGTELRSPPGGGSVVVPQLLLSPDAAACDLGDLVGTPVAPRRSPRRLSDNSLKIRYIDCSDSDGISLSSDSDALGAFDSDIGSPPSPKGWNLAPGAFLPDVQLRAHAQVSGDPRDDLSPPPNSPPPPPIPLPQPSSSSPNPLNLSLPPPSLLSSSSTSSDKVFPSEMAQCQDGGSVSETKC